MKKNLCNPWLKKITCIICVICGFKTHALIIYNGGADDDSAYTVTNGMPSGPDAAWDSVVSVTKTPGAFKVSAVYLGGGFFLTAKHVTAEVSPWQAQVIINGASYTLDMPFGTGGVLDVEHVPGIGHPVDLRIFKVLAPPALTPATLNRTDMEVSREGYVMGWGVGKGLAIPGEGWAWGANGTQAKRWGLVRITGQGMADDEYGGFYLGSLFSTGDGADVASGTVGDSGSGMFQNINGAWVLSGITVAVSANGHSFYNLGGGSPANPDATFYMRVAPYADAILSATRDVTAGGVAIPGLWFRTHYPSMPFDDYAALGGQPAANGVNSVADCYVAGLNPTNTANRFYALIAHSNGAPHIAWSPDLGASRTYTLQGKTNLTDTAWCPTNNATRFFKVTVGMP